jgi:uroporphyrinogen-III synthase
MKVKTILVSQTKPTIPHSPFFELEKKRKIKIDFEPFIHVKPVTVKEIRLQKIDLTMFTAIILTSRYAVDHYFRVCDKMRYKVPDSMKYFCQSEVVALYLQNHVVYRKRKIYVGSRKFEDLCVLIKKHETERFLLPTTDKLKAEVPVLLDELNINWKQAVFYRTVISDLSNLANVSYDILVFFSPTGIHSLLHNFPDFKQKNTRIATFGAITKKTCEENGLVVDISAPTKKFPSMTMALDNYIKKFNKKSKN